MANFQFHSTAVGFITAEEASQLRAELTAGFRQMYDQQIANLQAIHDAMQNLMEQSKFMLNSVPAPPEMSCPQTDNAIPEHIPSQTDWRQDQTGGQARPGTTEWTETGRQDHDAWTDHGREDHTDWTDHGREDHTEWTDRSRDNHTDWMDKGREDHADWTDKNREDYVTWTDTGQEDPAEWTDTGQVADHNFSGEQKNDRTTVAERRNKSDGSLNTMVVQDRPTSRPAPERLPASQSGLRFFRFPVNIHKGRRPFPFSSYLWTESVLALFLTRDFVFVRAHNVRYNPRRESISGSAFSWYIVFWNEFVAVSVLCMISPCSFVGNW
ncbi:uncharacterized protein LOC127257240 [Andrographis paniculata]|uniref:uncharacterized protein LOC127257240 n=1 Tax=Andrographis paniculata TaxID=175694 RepID=UPI0021E76C94|nr:uncharacterized protein LOC127257240 [Andrographis paniculata]